MVELSLSIYQHDQFGEIRTLINENGEPWFVAKEVAEALGYSNTRDAISKHCRCVAKHDLPHPQSHDKTIEVNIIPESDLYRLILRSKLPQAEAFQDWVTSEVLPSIRKHGFYRKESKDELTEGAFIEHNGSFWLDTETIAQQLRYMGFEEPTDHIEISYDNHRDFLSNYFAKIKGQNCFRDYGIVYILLIISVEVSKRKEEIQRLCTLIEGLLESLKGKSTKHIKVAAVRAYQEVVSRITATGNDVGFISNLVRYKRKELTTGEIAVLTGQNEEDVAVYLEELEASGIMDMADLLEGAAASAVCLPTTPIAKVENEHLFSVSKELIKALGFSEAMILQQLQTMISQEKRGYIHITYKEWLRRFPFKSEETLMRIVRKLEDMGIIVSKRVVINFQRIKEYRINSDILRKYAELKLSS